MLLLKVRMLGCIKKFISPPVFPGDEEKTRTAETLNTVLLGFIVILVLCVFALILIFEEKPTNALLILISFLVLSITYWLMRRGCVRLAGALVVSQGLFLFFIFLVLAGGPGSIAGIIGLGFTIIAGLLLGKRAALVSAAICSLAGLSEVIIESLGYTMPSLFPVPTISGWFVLSIALYMAVVTLDLTLRGINSSLLLARYQLGEREKAENVLRAKSIALDRERHNLQAIFNAAQVGMLLINQDKKIVRANETIAKYLNIDVAEFLDQQLGDGICCINALQNTAGCGKSSFCKDCAIRKAIEGVMKTGDTIQTTEIRKTLLISYIPHDVWIEISVTPVYLDEECYALMTIADITERKQTEVTLRNSEERLRERNQFLLALNEIAQTALSSHDLEVTYQVLAMQLRDLICADQCNITGWDAYSHRVIPITTSGIEREAYLQYFPEHGKRTMTEAVLQAGHYLIVEDTHNSEYIDPIIATRSSIISLLGVPLKTVHEDYGAILVGFYKKHHFTEDEIARCEQAANLVSLVTARLRLQDETQRRAQELEAIAQVSSAIRPVKTRAEIIQAVLCQLMTLFQADGAALLIQDPQTGDITVEAGQGIWTPFPGMTIPLGNSRGFNISWFSHPHLENEIIQLLNELGLEQSPGVKAIVGVPLIADSKLIGGLCIGRQTEIKETELRLLTAIGDIVANALRRSALHENLEAQLKMLKDTQDRLVQSEKLAAIGELVAGVAHELNNPLTSVVLYTQMLRAQSTDTIMSHDLEKIVEEAKRASKIVRGLLRFSRQHPTERKPVQINIILQSALELMSYELRTHNIQVTMHFDTDLPLTMADTHQLQQVFINLFTNSRQAFQEIVGRDNHLQLTTQTGPSVFSVPQPEAFPVIRIIFQDNGPGIPPEHLSHVFDPFFTTKEPGEGSGLGLSVCHGIITEHGGHIWAEGEFGKGATFFIELPIIAPEEPVEIHGMPLSITTQASQAKTARILFIDDEISVLAIVKRALERGGYIVDTVTNGVSGLALLGKASYDLILCDIRMSEMNGPDFYQVMELRFPEMTKHIIFTSGDLGDSTTRQFLERTGVPCLDKPFEIDELLKCIKAALEEIS